MIPQMIASLYGVTSHQELQTYMVAFYKVDIPVLLLISFFGFCFAIWAYRGIIRKFNKEDEPLFSRTGAIFFMFGYELMLLGLFLPHLANKLDIPLHILFFVLSLSPLYLVYLASQRTLLGYMEFAGLSVGPARNQTPDHLDLLRYSNLTLGLILFLIWALGTLILTKLTRTSLTLDLSLVACLSLSSLFLILLAELWVLYQPQSEKIGFLLAFLAGIYFVLPLILAGLLNNNAIAWVSPIGLFSTLFEGHDHHFYTLKIHAVSNLVLCVIPVFLVARQYQNILQVRKTM
jgi:hypothetical protein